MDMISKLEGLVKGQTFINDDFMLTNDFARELYHESAEKMPIIDYHCHLVPKMIADNYQFSDLTEVWLGGDHYKWRFMRSCGVEEKYITGDATDYEKFMKWAESLPYCIGNPLYHWTHLELQRYFGIYEPLSPKTADMIWEKCNEQIKAGGFTPRSLIEKSNVACVCTTDDAADSLEYHKLLAEDKSFKCKVIPAFRPDKSFLIDTPAFKEWIVAMEKAAEMEIKSYANLLTALEKRIAFFNEMGCRASDHALEYCPFELATEDELEAIFTKALAGGEVIQKELDQYRTALLQFFGEKYAELGWAMELHFGAMRNNNARMFKSVGADTGFDSVNDFMVAESISKLLDALEREDLLPKTILSGFNISAIMESPVSMLTPECRNIARREKRSAYVRLCNSICFIYV